MPKTIGVSFNEIKTANQRDDKILTFNSNRRRGCAVGVATRLRTGGSVLPIPGSETVFLSSPEMSARALRPTQPLYSTAAAGNFPAIKKPRHEVGTLNCI